MTNILITLIIALSPLLVFAWINLIYILVPKKEGANELSILAITSLYLFSLVPIGLLVGYYLSNKVIEVNGNKIKKYSKNIQSNGDLILMISIASTIFSLMNLK